MRILYICNQRLPTEKAYGIQVAKMCEAFADLGHEVTLLVPTRRNSIKEDVFDYYDVRPNFRVKRVWAPDWYLPGRWDRLAFEIKMFLSALILSWRACLSAGEAGRGNYDIIYSRDEWPLWFLSFSQRKLCFEVHRFSEMKKFFYHRFKKTGVKTIVISQGLKNKFLKLGFENKDVPIIPDGVDLEDFSCGLDRYEARRQVDLPDNKKILMYTGHLYDWKGAGLLLETARQFQFSSSPDLIEDPRQSRDNFQKNNSEVLFVFVGGTDEDVKNFRVAAEGLEYVLILGHKPHRDIPVYLKAADVLVLPNKKGEAISESYTSPLKLFEYMASGRPIVASDLPSIREILNDKNAFFFKDNDSLSLIKAINAVMSDSILASFTADMARADVEQYTWTKRAQRITSFLKETLSP